MTCDLRTVKHTLQTVYPLLSIRSIRTDQHMAYTDRYGAGVLDNAFVSQRIVT